MSGGSHSRWSVKSCCPGRRSLNGQQDFVLWTSCLEAQVELSLAVVQPWRSRQDLASPGVKPVRARQARTETPGRAPGQKGAILIEVLIAFLVASIFSAGILQLYVHTFSLSNMAQSQIMAASIAQECIDSIRALPYSTVCPNSSPQTHYAVMSGTQASCTDSLFPRPLLQDTTALTYSAGAGSSTATGGNTRFQVVNNQVQIVITPAAQNIWANVAVSFTYLDGSGSHTYRGYTILVQNGLNS